MRNTLLLIFITMFQAYAADTYSQNTKLTLNLNNVSVANVLEEIQNHSEFYFLFNAKLIDANREVSVSMKDKKISEILNSLFSGTDVKYLVYDKQIILTQGDVSSLSAKLQQLKITGTVTDKDGTPLPGVNVVVTGTTLGTMTDISGKYSIDVPQGSKSLTFSFVGMEQQEIAIGSLTQINVTLLEAAIGLKEIIVIGYGTVTKQDVTGSVTDIGVKDFNKGLSSLSPQQLIQGKVPGVQILNNSGAPDAEMTIRVRGTSSVRSGNQPLFVVDGIPLDGRNTQPSVSGGSFGDTPGSNPLSFLNSNDIESMNILKDASSTAIYGSRGANGVVIITTKKGKAGVPRIDFNVAEGISSMFRAPERMDAAQYREAIQMRGLLTPNIDGGSSTNALTEITRLASVQNYNIALSGGNEKGNYRISLGYVDQQGIIKKSDLKKYTGSLNSNHSFLADDRLNVEVNLKVSNTVNSGVGIFNNSNAGGSLIGEALSWNPTIPLRYPDGTFVQHNYISTTHEVDGLDTNPLAISEYYNDRSDVSNILADVSPSFRIIKGLEYKFTLGINQSKGNRANDISGKLDNNGDITGKGFTDVSTSRLTTTTIDHILNYKNKIGANLNLDAIVGYEYLNYTNSNTNITATGFTNFDVLGSSILQNASSDKTSISSYTDPTNSLQSYFSRVNLNFSSKYLLTATIRADGSTKFGVNNKYGYFPSVAGAWILSKEKFVPEAISNLKLRASYGKTGNQEFPSGSAQSRYSYGQQSLALSNVANPNLKWETTTTYDFGFDFGIIKDRFSGTVDYFSKTTTDLLFQMPTVQPAPTANFWINLPANVKNSGMEVSLKGVLIEKSNLYWDLNFNASFLQNKLTKYSGAPILTGNASGSGLADGLPTQQLINNQPLYVFYMYKFLGLNPDGTAIYSANREYVGDPSPKTLLGISSSLTVGKLAVSLSLNGAFGQKVYNNTAMVDLSPTNLASGMNTTPEIGLSNESLSNANVISTRYLENGNFMKLSDVGISYNIGAINKLKNINISLTGQNLLIFTKYTGFDPEVNTNKSVNGVPSLGIDYEGYPTARTIMIGINASF